MSYFYYRQTAKKFILLKDEYLNRNLKKKKISKIVESVEFGFSVCRYVCLPFSFVITRVNKVNLT